MELQEEWKNVDESFRQYRASQLALSATIIGVSGAVIYWILESFILPHLIAKVLLGLAVCAALLMQLLHAFGYMNHARAYVCLVRTATQNRSAAEKKEAVEQYNKHCDKGTRFFNALDRVTLCAFFLCIAGLLVAGVWHLFNQGASTPAITLPL